MLLPLLSLSIFFPEATRDNLELNLYWLNLLIKESFLLIFSYLFLFEISFDVRHGVNFDWNLFRELLFVLPILSSDFFSKIFLIYELSVFNMDKYFFIFGFILLLLFSCSFDVSSFVWYSFFILQNENLCLIPPILLLLFFSFSTSFWLLINSSLLLAQEFFILLVDKLSVKLYFFSILYLFLIVILLIDILSFSFLLLWFTSLYKDLFSSLNLLLWITDFVSIFSLVNLLLLLFILLSILFFDFLRHIGQVQIYPS